MRDAVRVLSSLLFTVQMLAGLTGSAVAYDTIGNGFASKWGDDPDFGTGAIVTWGYMLDGTDVDPDFRIDPFGFPDISGVVGTSNITALRNSVDTDYGAGSFDVAIQNAFNTWSSVANITFVGPVTDSGLDVGSTGATSPMIRVGAFAPDPTHWFANTSAVGFGPPGPSGPDFFPLSGDILFNLNGKGLLAAYQIAPGTEDVTPVDVANYGDDVEGLFLHELGHAAIGLNHPRWAGEDPDQRVMYVGDFDDPESPLCCQSINRELHEDDIAAAQYVYGIRGDYNRDGVVDAADYTVWRDAFGGSVSSGTGADGNVDAMVDEFDYFVWRDHFGDEALEGFGEQPSFGAGFSSVTVPEPSALWLCLLAGTICFSTARGRSSSPGVAGACQA